MEKAMIECRGLCKTYRVAKREAGLGNAVKALFSREYELVRALREVSFTVQDGEIVGYIGPNGAGKSTTIKTMCGILTPDAGECVINGRTPWKERKSMSEKSGWCSGKDPSSGGTFRSWTAFICCGTCIRSNPWSIKEILRS